jgi:hypothetical protein
MLAFFLLWLNFSSTSSNNKIIYLEPQPDANFVNVNNNIIIGFEKPIGLGEKEILSCINVKGSRGRNYDGTAIVCGDNMKIIYKPFAPFNFNEKITISLTGKLLKTISRAEYKYSFNTALRKASWNYTKSIKQEFNYQGNSLLDPPQLTVTIDNNPSEGLFFSTPWSAGSDLVITNNNGTPNWYLHINVLLGDFKKQPNGDLTYFDSDLNKHFEMDENYNVVNTYYCGNGYTTDIHELRVLNNGHALVMAYDPEIVDMSHIVSGGDTNATVIGLIIQEIDENKNVIFQWRSWDHFAITDETHENLLDSVIDYVHGNAIEVDNDNNLLISSRHIDEITKINRTTGAIIWRLGGRNNQFTFVNDPIRFSHQHAIRRIPNGNITLYDNGNFHTPHFSRAVEYSLDEINKIATLVWQYRNNPDIYGYWGGYVQRLNGGNTLISWGGANTTITEVKQDGTVVFEGSYPLGVYTYRAYKFDWGNPVAVNSEANGTPKLYKLYQNFPNPFNPQTTISFDIPKASQTELAIFDITGRQIKKVVNEYLQSGSYKFSFDGSQLSSGLYIYRLHAGDFSAAGKMILLK